MSRRPWGEGATSPRLLYVETSPFSSYGGSKRVLVRLLPSLDRASWSPHALFYREGPWADDLRRAGIPVTIVEGVRSVAEGAAGAAPPGPVILRRWLESIEGGQMARRLQGPRRWLRELRFLDERERKGRQLATRLRNSLPAGVSLIHFNGSMDEDLGWYQLARSAGIPYVLHEHRPWGRRPLVWKDVARRAGAVVCLTRERADIVQDFAGPGVRTVVIPNGVGEDAFTPRRSGAEVRRELGIGAETALLVTAGYIQSWKGQHLVVEAAAQLKESGRRFVWLICGGVVDAAYLDRVRRLITDLGVQEEVRLTGDRSDLGDIFAAADLAVHTSVLPEPFGLVVVEAMAAGTAVAGPGEGALLDLVRDGVDGRLFTPRDVPSMIAVISALLDDPILRQGMGRSAQERARGEYSLPVQVHRLERLYESILGGAATPP